MRSNQTRMGSSGVGIVVGVNDGASTKGIGFFKILVGVRNRCNFLNDDDDGLVTGLLLLEDDLKKGNRLDFFLVITGTTDWTGVGGCDCGCGCLGGDSGPLKSSMVIWVTMLSSLVSTWDNPFPESLHDAEFPWTVEESKLKGWLVVTDGGCSSTTTNN